MAGALEKSQNIDQYNEDRKELDKRITEEASRILEEHIDINRRKSIVIYNKDWHKGIIGIVFHATTELFIARRRSYPIRRTGHRVGLGRYKDSIFIKP